MKRFYIEIGQKDDGQQARLLHKEDCQKLKNPERVEEAQRLFRDTQKCPHCATGD